MKKTCTHKPHRQRSALVTTLTNAAASIPYQVDDQLGNLGHEFQVEEVRELVGPSSIHPGVHHIQHITQERGHNGHQQDQELAKRQKKSSAESSTSPTNSSAAPQIQRG
ncbi:unnamed protein product [Phytophthora lilii]|uniref:Unnamed protein product n=1 Tax=Phytophthora lilii TaxID=2077276 RepID=A0A9W6X0D8_9STRA|nr:unnamed protein product [Phytophthora lilii]